MAKMWKYISGVYKVVHKRKNEKAPKSVRDTREYEKLHVDKDHGRG